MQDAHMQQDDRAAAALDAINAMDERALAREYDRQRRRRLLTSMGLLFGVAATGIFASIAAAAIVQGAVFSKSTMVTEGYVVVTCLLFFGTGFAARRQHVRLGAGLFALAAGVVTPLNALSGALTSFFDPAVMLFLAGAIVLVSVAGELWMMFGVAALSSAVTLYCLLYAPRPPLIAPYYEREAAGLIPIALIFYWGLALLLALQWRSYQRTLLDLSDVRAEIARARRLDELKDQFIRSVNHELRTPIMAILGYLDLLMQPAHRAVPDRVDRYIRAAHRSGQALRALLASILDARRLDLAGETIVPKAVAVNTALEGALPMIPFADEIAGGGEPVERELRVHIPPGLAVWAEPMRVRQILVNLLTNAVKYSGPGTPVEVSARLIAHAPRAGGRRSKDARPPAGMVEIAVRDYGFGIPPGDIPLLFQRFVRLPRDLESSTVGTGLGLYLCRTLAEQMGGSIRVESSGVRGEGSTFFVLLPAVPASPQADAPLGDPERAAAGVPVAEVVGGPGRTARHAH
jgi:signal transduction histidine kinase